MTMHHTTAARTNGTDDPLAYGHDARGRYARTPARWTRRLALGLAWFFGLFCVFDGGARIVRITPYVEGLTHFGFDPAIGPWIGAMLIICTVLYLVPRTAVLGAIGLAAYLGGAAALHLSVSEPFWFPVMMGLVFWWSLWIRDAHVRALLPLSRSPLMRTSTSHERGG